MSVTIFLTGGRDHGGPILTFPEWQHAEKINAEDLKRLVVYLANVPRFVLIVPSFHNI